MPALLQSQVQWRMPPPTGLSTSSIAESYPSASAQRPRSALGVGIISSILMVSSRGCSQPLTRLSPPTQLFSLLSVCYNAPWARGWASPEDKLSPQKLTYHKESKPFPSLLDCAKKKKKKFERKKKKLLPFAFAEKSVFLYPIARGEEEGFGS